MRWGFGFSQGPFELWQAAGWSTVARWMQEDIDAGRVVTGDEVCFEVVGAGPERGAFTLPYRVREPVRTRDFIPN